MFERFMEKFNKRDEEEELDLGIFVKKAMEKKVAVVPGTAFTPDENAPSHSFRITYSTPSDNQLTDGVKIISRVISEMLGE